MSSRTLPTRAVTFLLTDVEGSTSVVVDRLLDDDSGAFPIAATRATDAWLPRNPRFTDNARSGQDL